MPETKPAQLVSGQPHRCVRHQKDQLVHQQDQQHRKLRQEDDVDRPGEGKEELDADQG